MDKVDYREDTAPYKTIHSTIEICERLLIHNYVSVLILYNTY